MKYAVETWTLCDGWINTWSDDNGNPVVFDTKEEAEQELKDFLFDQHEAVLQCDMIDDYSEEDFRVVPVEENK